MAFQMLYVIEHAPSSPWRSGNVRALGSRGQGFESPLSKKNLAFEVFNLFFFARRLLMISEPFLCLFVKMAKGKGKKWRKKKVIIRIDEKKMKKKMDKTKIKRM